MSKESRKKLASLTFTEKVKLLEKLRQRSLVLAKAREKLKKNNEAKNRDAMRGVATEQKR